MPQHSPRRWCVLIHALPAQPLYLRARVRRQLALAGAAPLKNAVYVLPHSDEGLGRLRAIAAEIQAAGAAAFVCEATFPDAETEAVVTRACQREVRKRSRSRPRGPLVGLRWVTRRGVHVDRIACAWVVRRFIDPSAKFRFVASPEAPLAHGEIGFDMPGAAITHEGGHCSVEVLVRRAGVTDPAVRRIAEIVHDIDLKDARHGHAETAGFEQVLVGTLQKHAQDPDRLEHGFVLFDALHAAASARPAPTLMSPPGRRPRGRG